MSNESSIAHSLSSPSLLASLVAYIRRHWTLAHCIRLTLVMLMTTLSLLGGWAGLISPAYAAVLQHRLAQTPASHTAVATGVHTLTGASKGPIRHAVPRALSSQQPIDGLGKQSFYTYITLHINDRIDLNVNVANGNLVLHTQDLQIKGTGLDETLESYYNSQSNVPRDHGSGWNFSFGHDVYLDLSNLSSGITFHDPTGTSAFFAASGSSFTPAPGFNAALTANTSNHTYTLQFHRTGASLTFNSAGYLISEQDQNHNTISFRYDGSNNLTSLTDTQGRVTNFTTASGQITKITDPASRTISYGYQNGNLTSLTDASGAVTTFSYNGNDLIGITDPLGNTTTINYLTGDAVSSITDATGKGTISFTYNSGNTVVTNRNGNPTTYGYDTNTLQVNKVTDAQGNVEQSQFDTNYDPKNYQDALGNTQQFNFDSVNHTLTSVTDADGAATSYTYNNTNQSSLYYPSQQTDPQSNTTTYSYDGNGNVASATDKSSGTALTFSYNSNGTIAWEKDGKGNQTSFSYDSKGNLIEVDPPAPLGKTTLTIDPATSRVLQMVDGNGNQILYQYDALNRITQVKYNPTGAVISYTYDANGNLLNESDNTGLTRFGYDALNRQVKKTLPSGKVIPYTYDKQGNLTSLTDAGGTVTYVYDSVNHMTQLIEPDGATTTYTYDALGRKTGIFYPNNTGMLMTYSKAGRELTNIGGILSSDKKSITTQYSNFQYNYGLNGKNTTLIQSMTKFDPVKHDQSYTHTFTYDSLNQLKEDLIKSLSGIKVEDYQFSYDAAGNRTSYFMYSSNEQESYSYNAANELTSKTENGTTTTYSYDGNGNLTGWTGGPSFTYNNKNQTTSIGSENYTYAGPDQTDMTQKGDDAYVYTLLGMSSKTDSSGTVFYRRCSCGLLNSEQTPDGKTYYYLFDGLGSIIGLTDASGNEVNRYNYEDFGNIHTQQETVQNEWKFAGGYMDDATGFYKFGTRYYMPDLGRWTQQDPMGGSLANFSSYNRYVYANNDPVNATDPSGGFSLTVGCISVIISEAVALIPAIQGIISAEYGWMAFAAFIAALSSGPLGWIIYVVSLSVSVLISAALTIAAYEGVAAACGLPAIP